MSRKIKISAICILLITTILCSFLILPVSAATEADANYDGRVSIQDATYIRKLTANIN